MSLSPGERDPRYPDGRPLSEQPRWRQDFPTDIPDDDLLARREATKATLLALGGEVRPVHLEIARRLMATGALAAVDSGRC